ncbi:MAG: hypothetical protein WAM80_00310, partial [Candidatus Acidiferrales bacterium]
HFPALRAITPHKSSLLVLDMNNAVFRQFMCPPYRLPFPLEQTTGPVCLGPFDSPSIIVADRHVVIVMRHGMRPPFPS